MIKDALDRLFLELQRMWACYAVMQKDSNMLVRVSYTDRKKARMELEEL